MREKKLYNLTNDELFEIIGDISSLFHRVLSIENTIILTDTEKILGYFLGSEVVNKQPNLIGKPIPTSGNIPITLKTGDIKTSIIPKELYGVAFKSTTIPILDREDDIIGTISLALSLKSQTTLQNTIETISSSAEQLSDTTEELASSASFLSDNVSDVLDQTLDILKLIEEANQILDFVNSVAKNSRLLGLNAAIQAARAGESGKGFAVVAEEIRKMAENSAKSVVETKALISTINTKVNYLMKKVEALNDVSHTQAAATQEITATIQNFAVDTQTLKTISEVI
ncbi:chemotaxis protein [Desulfosporosinus sp. HMP52]|uniref:methyl-accepting chemotaxis protein n=1 Tax=Desulfosporosinus sp. HMP52 TaxID=1487923 RepID=UPI00051FAA73|nr:methyl-accepting chemotaxis protein [Desulfosporosinus sp. HMP52]KGK90450.1 chemotaxis protein [Desulfosporosinus sp. HMP52]